MIRKSFLIGAGAAALAASGLVHSQSERRFSADASATAGYSSNPLLVRDGDTDTPVVTIDIAPRYQIATARSTFTIAGDANIQRYLRRFGGSENFAASLDYVNRVSEHLTAHAHADASSSILGASNFLPYANAASASLVPVGAGTSATGVDAGVAAGTVVTAPATVVLPGNYNDVGLYGLGNRRNAFGVSGDIGLALSARDNLTAAAYGQYSRYGGGRSVGLNLNDYDAYGGSLGYQRQVNAGWSLGVRGSASSYSYRNFSASDSRVYSIVATATGRLNERWSIDGSLGASFVDGGGVGSTRRTSPSGSLNVCRRAPLSSLCLQASHQVSPTGLAGSQYVTSVGGSYSQQLDHHQALSVGGSYSDVGGDNLRSVAGVPLLQNRFAQAFASYSRQLGERLRLIAQGSYRQVFGGGAGNAHDVGGQIGLSYRIGDRR